MNFYKGFNHPNDDMWIDAFLVRCYEGDGKALQEELDTQKDTEIVSFLQQCKNLFFTEKEEEEANVEALKKEKKLKRLQKKLGCEMEGFKPEKPSEIKMDKVYRKKMKILFFDLLPQLVRKSKILNV